MTSSAFAWWPQQPSTLGRAGPDTSTKRPDCDCHIDPIVFGHHFTCTVLAGAS